MKVAKAVGPDNTPVEIWKSLGEEGLEWSTNFFNVILVCNDASRMETQYTHTIV